MTKPCFVHYQQNQSQAVGQWGDSFFICSFVSSVLVDQCDGYVVGTCAETVAKRTVQQEENIVMVVARGTVECGGDTRVVIVFAR